jgi:hypothetical protein
MSALELRMPDHISRADLHVYLHAIKSRWDATPAGRDMVARAVVEVLANPERYNGRSLALAVKALLAIEARNFEADVRDARERKAVRSRCAVD